MLRQRFRVCSCSLFVGREQAPALQCVAKTAQQTEIFLMQHFDEYYNKAFEATENLKEFYNDLEKEYICVVKDIKR